MRTKKLPFLVGLRSSDLKYWGFSHYLLFRAGHSSQGENDAIGINASLADLAPSRSPVRVYTLTPSSNPNTILLAEFHPPHNHAVSNRNNPHQRQLTGTTHSNAAVHTETIYK